MSELFMECVEEELEPWQKQVPEVNLIEDDDDEPIFVGVLSNDQKDGKPDPAPPPKRNTAEKQQAKHLQTSTVTPTPIMLPLSIAGNPVHTAAPSLTTMTPQPVIVNNQGFIVTPQLANNSDFIASLGSQYPPGTSFTIVPAGQQPIFQRVTPGTVMPGAVHRPQVQQISNNIVTLTNVQSPAVYSGPSNQMQANRSISQPLQTLTIPTKTNSNSKDQVVVKRAMPTLQQMDSTVKRVKLDPGPTKAVTPVENGIFKRRCPKCKDEFVNQDVLRNHMMTCCTKFDSTPPPPPVDSGANKRIMLVSDFYYGRFDGDGMKKDSQKTSATFKCQSCLKVLKNNIRFMNHMKHHLELEKQNSESWESHTTCQHCYRQYMTPFQLQCHIESAHSPIESSTNCKICELAFDSEQVLLEHMKDNHKPGEMPYVCQVCNYRSSFFSDVETHFRSVHCDTKDLLCPFCLKVLRSTHMYMQHYMKHQKKGIHRCGKCRLNFLTYKEKVEHRTHVHKTFRKPRALEGLPPGTKVTIRASLTGKAPTLPNSPDRSGVVVSPDTLSFNQQTKPPISVFKSKMNVAGAGKTKATQNKKHDRSSKHNLALRDLSITGGCYTCIECNSRVDDFFSHFPMISSCGACKYKTSCKLSIGNHMIRFHSLVGKNRVPKVDRRKPPAVKLTLVCLSCDLLVDASGADLMSKHLADKPKHICKVIQDKDMKAKDRVYTVMIQPTTVMYLLTPTPAQKSQEMQLKVAESVAPPSVNLASVSQPVSVPTLAASDQEKGSTETCATASSSEGQLKPLSPPAVSSPSTSDVALDPCDKPVAHSEGTEAREELPVSESIDIREEVPVSENSKIKEELAALESIKVKEQLPVIEKVEVKEETPVSENIDVKEKLPVSSSEAKEKRSVSESSEVKKEPPVAEDVEAKVQLPNSESVKVKEELPAAEDVEAKVQLPGSQSVKVKEELPAAEDVEAEVQLPVSESTEVKEELPASEIIPEDEKQQTKTE